MNTCQNPKCGIKFKKGANKYCCMSCFRVCQKKQRQKKISTIKTERTMWKYFWAVKLKKATLGKITKEEYEAYDYVFTYQTFVNIRA